MKSVGEDGDKCLWRGEEVKKMNPEFWPVGSFRRPFSHLHAIQLKMVLGFAVEIAVSTYNSSPGHSLTTTLPGSIRKEVQNDGLTRSMNGKKYQMYNSGTPNMRSGEILWCKWSGKSR